MSEENKEEIKEEKPVSEPSKEAAETPKEATETKTSASLETEKSVEKLVEKLVEKPAEGKPKPKATIKPKAKPVAQASGEDQKKVRELFTGRRKVSISRAKLLKGSGKITVNKKPIEEYFSKKGDVYKVFQPLILVGVGKDFDVFANVKGGGSTGQAEAVRLSISRALKEMDIEYHKKLREAGMLTRDSRMVERKKYGLHKARRASQFSKR